METLLDKIMTFPCGTCVIEYECQEMGHWMILRTAGGGAIKWKEK